MSLNGNDCCFCIIIVMSMCMLSFMSGIVLKLSKVLRQ